MQRHLIGTMSRLAVILLVVVASGVDTAIDAWRSRPPREEEPPPDPMPWETAYSAEDASKVTPDA